MNLKGFRLYLMLTLTACQQTLKTDVIVPMCPEEIHQEEVRYKNNTFFARSSSGIDRILLNNTYLRPMDNKSLDLEFDFTLNPSDSFVVYANGKHHTIKDINHYYPGAELKMEGNILTITYQCEMPIFE
ncbi:MAG: hypothetical protein ACKOXF_01030 [Chitinophagaceae bacterium]